MANGYLGVQGSFEGRVPDSVRSIRGAYINGFYDESPIHYEERLHDIASTQQSMVNLPDVQGLEVLLNGERFSLFSGRVDQFSQALDTASGIYTRDITWTSPRGQSTRLIFRRLASFALPQLFLIDLQLGGPGTGPGPVRSVPSGGDVRQDSDPKDPRKAAIGRKTLEVAEVLTMDGLSLMQLRRLGSGLSLASAVGHQAPQGFAKSLGRQEDLVSWLYEGQINQRGQPLAFQQILHLCGQRAPSGAGAGCPGPAEGGHGRAL